MTLWHRWRRFPGAIVVLLALGGPAVPLAAQLAHPSIDLHGRLYRAVFAPGPEVLSSGDLAAVDDTTRARLSLFLQRRAAFRSRYRGAPEDTDGVLRDAKRRAIERAIVSLSPRDDIAPQALAFVQEAPIADEWDGRPAAPLAEAAYAAKVLDLDPATPLAPFLHLFIAQRQRAAAEAATFQGDAAAAASAAAAVQRHLAAARADPDPIYGLVADDLERVERVYLRK